MAVACLKSYFGDNVIVKNSIPLTEKKLKKYDCFVISTDHSSYFIAKHSNLIVDTRNAMKRVSRSNREKIRKA